MESLTNGLSQGDFTLLRVLSNGAMTDILTLIGSGGSGAVTSATAPLSISNGVLSINLSGYMATTHEANKIGSADMTHGQFDFNTKTVTLQNNVGVTVVLSVDGGGNLNLGADGVLTVPMLNTWEYTSISMKDSGGTVRNLVPSLNGSLVYNSSQLVDLNDLGSYTTTSAMNTLLNAKQDVLTSGAGIFLSASTINSYTLRWNGSSTPTVPTAIQELHWDDYTVSENVNLSTGKIELLIGHPTDMASQTWANGQFQPLLTGVSQSSVYLLSPTHMPSRYGVATWTNNGTDATISLGVGGGQDHFHSPYAVLTGDVITLSVDVKLGTATNMCLAWWGIASTIISFSTAQGLNTSTFTTISTSFTATSSTNLEWNIGFHWLSSVTAQSTGTAIVKNIFVQIAGASIVTTFTGDVNVSGTLTCNSLVQTSDESVKAGIEDVSTTVAESILLGCNARTFVRTDLGEDPDKLPRRIGFIAQELQATLPEQWQNIVHEKDNLLGVSYDRLCCILWTCLQNTNARVAALEQQITKSKPKASKKTAG